MKLVLTLKADNVNTQILNTGYIVVDVDGANLSGLISGVSEDGYLFCVIDKPDQHVTSTPPPLTTLTYIRRSTAHITETDNAWLCSPLYRANDSDGSEWIHFTGSGYLLRTDTWLYSVPRLKHLGPSKTFRCLVVTLTRRYGISLIHLDVSAECLPNLPTFNW